MNHKMCGLHEVWSDQKKKLCRVVYSATLGLQNLSQDLDVSRSECTNFIEALQKPSGWSI